MLAIVNAGLSFILEVLTLMVYGYVAYQWVTVVWLKVALAVLLPVGVVIVWSRFAAPNAKMRLAGWALLGFKLGIFMAAVAMLYVADLRQWGFFLGVIVLVNLIIEYITDWR